MSNREIEILAAAMGVLKALEFYADPYSYLALVVFSDSPCGDFVRDVSPLTDADPYEDYRGDGSGYYGKKARDALTAWHEAYDRPAEEPMDWQSIDTAPDHVKEAASVALMMPGRSRARFYHGPDQSLYALWNGGDAGSPATLWCQLPDLPIMIATSSDNPPDAPPSQT